MSTQPGHGVTGMATGSAAVPLLRAVLLLAGCAAGGLFTWWLTVQPLTAVAMPLLRGGPAGLRGLAFSDALSGLMAALLLVCAAWLLLGTTLAAASLLLRQVAPAVVARAGLVAALTDGLDRACPATLRRVVAVALGVAVTAGAAAPALAAPTGGQRLDGLTMPDRVSGAATAGGMVSAARTVLAARPATVVVRPGDSLWSITAATRTAATGRAGSDAAVLRACDRLYAANRGRIGDDPDLILPGTRLRVPESIAADPEEAP